jgi:hypothetical protein
VPPQGADGAGAAETEDDEVIDAEFTHD